MRLLFLSIFISASLSSLGQESVNVQAAPQSNYDSVRSIYIRTYPDHFFLWNVLKQRKLDFEMRSTKDRANGVAFKTNKPYSLGIGLYVFELGVEIAFAVPLNEQSIAIYGESDTRDFQINTFGKRWGADAYYQKYKGFYIDDLNEDIPANTPYPQRPDIETRNIGITGNYVFNSKKFSFRSAYNFSERQVRSAGTFVVFVSLNGFRATGDTALIGSTYDARFGVDAAIKEIKINTFGIAPGYSYNFVYKGFFLTGVLAVGPSYNWVSYERMDGIQSTKTKLDSYVAARLAIGYNGDRFFGGLTFISQARSAKFEEVTLSSSNNGVKIIFGYRIREFGFLKKRIWDIPKAIF